MLTASVGRDVAPSPAWTSTRIGRLSPIIEAAKAVAQLATDKEPISICSHAVGGMQVLLHGRDRHDAPVGVLQMQPRLLGLHGRGP